MEWSICRKYYTHVTETNSTVYGAKVVVFDLSTKLRLNILITFYLVFVFFLKAITAPLSDTLEPKIFRRVNSAPKFHGV